MLALDLEQHNTTQHNTAQTFGKNSRHNYTHTYTHTHTPEYEAQVISTTNVLDLSKVDPTPPHVHSQSLLPNTTSWGQPSENLPPSMI